MIFKYVLYKILKLADIGRRKQNRIVAEIELAQNQCLRIITGAYKATPLEFLHSEAMIRPVRIMLDRLLLREIERLEASPVRGVIEEACRQIRIRTGAGLNRKGKRNDKPTPWQQARIWCKQTRAEAAEDGEGENWTDRWAENVWRARWEEYTGAKVGTGYPALYMDPRLHYKIHGSMSKAESALLTQIRTGRIGLNQF